MPAPMSAEAGQADTRDAGGWRRTSVSSSSKSGGYVVIPHDARRLHRAAHAAPSVPRRAAAMGPRPGRHLQSLQAHADRHAARRHCSRASCHRHARDFPSIFNQGPREGMHLHWDGNNTSLAERNLSAAIGAGVTPETVDHRRDRARRRWLETLQPPRKPASARSRRGRGAGARLYMKPCAPAMAIKDPRPLHVRGGQARHRSSRTASSAPIRGGSNSYTEEFRQRQLAELFVGTPFQFKHFVKTNGYANMPLDALVAARRPICTTARSRRCADLLAPPAQRPSAFVRGIDIIEARTAASSRRAARRGAARRRASVTTLAFPATATAATPSGPRCRRTRRRT